ncbi:MAG: hypothetical protein HQL67_09385 [Magnetococcales bacterium]|nr:hypothetical protein [Magnetococcales bacterium]
MMNNQYNTVQPKTAQKQDFADICPSLVEPFDSPDQSHCCTIHARQPAEAGPSKAGLKLETVAVGTQREHPIDNQFRESDLPDSLTEIKEVVGLQGALILLNRCGGTRLFIPRRLKAQHKLANLLGLEAARLMSAYFGGETLTIVRGSRAKKLARNRSLIHRYDAGERVAELAVAFELTERQVYTILSKDNG